MYLFFPSFFDLPMPTLQQLRGQLLVLHVSDAASSRNPANVVVAVAEVLGSKIAAESVMQNLTTVGMRGFKLATLGQSPRRLSTANHTPLSIVTSMVMLPLWPTGKRK